MSTEEKFERTLRETLDGVTGIAPISDVAERLEQARRRRTVSRSALIATAAVCAISAAVLVVRDPSPTFFGGDPSHRTGEYLVDIEVELQGDAPFTVRAESAGVGIDEGDTATHVIVIESEEHLAIGDTRWELSEDRDGAFFGVAGYHCGYSISRPEFGLYKEPPPPEGAVSQMCLGDGRLLRAGPDTPLREEITIYAGLEDWPIATGRYELRQKISWWRIDETDPAYATHDGEPDGESTAVVTYTVYENPDAPTDRSRL